MATGQKLSGVLDPQSHQISGSRDTHAEISVSN